MLALATEGRAGGYRGSMLWDLKQQPGLVARADARAREWLRLRPASRSPNPPAAA
ncbi:hypothetical protein [Arenimonas daejeonensis]|uniref:hypothetical protein n=1 Tax=Arenimonas daejeonensis TaxID=370777 RepID=UPI001D14A493|nr:hypothetical protein [Arenimonas daejeonensis]